MTEDPGGRGLKLATNVVPLRTPKSLPRKQKPVAFASCMDVVRKLRPEEPVHALRPHVIASKAKWFLQNFPGDVLFAVKTNPDPRVLKTMWDAGVRHFDVASQAEIELVAGVAPSAHMYYMHPVKSRESIERAYFDHGIRHFSLDSHEELQKIQEATGFADDLSLLVRLGIPNEKAAYSLSGKFGVPLEDAVSLMQATSKAAAKFGVCFHVGSQCMDPSAYATTIGYVRDLLTVCDVKLDMLDVGGGFPSAYPGMMPPKMVDYMAAIREAIKTLPIGEDCHILCEPGRALVAEGGSLIVRVELRKGNALYINDGVYGSLFDAGSPAFVFPMKAMRLGGKFAENTNAFSFFGPTCDSCDAMAGPFVLPADIREGDYIEIGQMGAYGATMRTKFNGFYSDTTVDVKDEALLRLEME
jgi:ornithine decarboxylase